jgi:chorismate mutase/prephenate dehydratase
VSNAEAARRARNSDDAAAIAGESAGHVYGLRVVAGPVEDRADNTTRFLVLGPRAVQRLRPRPHLAAGVRARPAGRAVRVLSPFARHGISMNRIESRPSHAGRWQYAFFIDVAGHVDDGR